MMEGDYGRLKEAPYQSKNKRCARWCAPRGWEWMRSYRVGIGNGQASTMAPGIIW